MYRRKNLVTDGTEEFSDPFLTHRMFSLCHCGRTLTQDIHDILKFRKKLRRLE